MTRKPKPPAPVVALIKAKALLERKGWVQGCAAVNAGGKFVDPTPRAVSFCALGALVAVSVRDTYRRSYILARHLLDDATPTPYSIVGYNDTKGRTKAQILRLYDRAIALGLHWEKEAADAT